MAGGELIESRIEAGRWSGLVRLTGPSPGFAVIAGGGALMLAGIGTMLAEWAKQRPIA